MSFHPFSPKEGRLVDQLLGVVFEGSGDRWFRCDLNKVSWPKGEASRAGTLNSLMHKGVCRPPYTEGLNKVHLADLHHVDAEGRSPTRDF